MISPFDNPEVKYHCRRGNYAGVAIYTAVYGIVKFLETCNKIEESLCKILNCSSSKRK
jgi:hypothetical protein